LDSAIVLARFAAFVAGTALFGAPLFVLYSRGGSAVPRLLRPVLIGAAFLALLAADVALVAQTGQMAGDAAAGFNPATLHEVVIGSGFGRSIVARAAAGFLALALLIAMRPGRRLWTLTAIAGAVALGATAWGGHGAADSGAAGLVHLAADVIHLLAAGVWLGALFCLALLLRLRESAPTETGALLQALKGFSGIGSVAVALIVASGLVNSWFLVGLRHLSGLVTSPWGELLLIKLALFVAMVVMAALNRFRLTPRLEASLPGDPGDALSALRRSVTRETVAGMIILVLVAGLGMLAPPASM
jgi:putative copper resistance protein D